MAFTTEMCICCLGKYLVQPDSLVQLRKPATQGVRFKSGSATIRDVHFAKKNSRLLNPFLQIGPLSWERNGTL
jgi:hypothetical protein